MRRRVKYLALAIMIGVAGELTLSLLSAELPYGQVSGTLLTAEAGTPLAGVLVQLSSGSEESRSRARYSAETDDQGKFSFHHVQAGSYRLVTHTEAHRQPQEPIEVAEGQMVEAVYELQPTDPFLKLMEHERVFTTREEPSVRCHGFAPTNELQVKVFQVNPQLFLHGFSAWLASNQSRLHGGDLSSLTSLTQVSSRAVPIAGRDSEGVFRQQIPLGTLRAGGYLVAVETEQARETLPLTVTDLGLVVKGSPRGVLAYAVDLATGAPLAGATVAAVRADQTVGQGVTGAGGVAWLPMPPRKNGDSSLEIVARSGDSAALADLSGDWATEGGALKVYTYTDRPVYRPGQRVYFKSVLRELQGDNYVVPANRAAKVQVTDERGNLVYAGAAQSNAYGSLHGQFDLSAGAQPGSYLLRLAIGAQPYEANFSVAEYRKPEFEVSVTPTKERFVSGEQFTATLTALYYYGAPLAHARVSYSLSRTPQGGGSEQEQWNDDLGRTPDDSGDYGDYVAQGEGRTDAQGRLTVSLPTRGEKDKPETQESDYRYTLRATVQAEDRQAEGSGEALVTQGDFRLEADLAQELAAPGQPVAITVRAMDYQGQPVPGVRGEAILEAVNWQGNTEVPRRESEQSWTAASGQAEAQLTPQRPGDYRIVLQARDRSGHTIRATQDLWVMSEPHADLEYPYQDLDMRADQKVYQPGAVARLVVNTKYAPATALLTIESNGILEQRLVKLEGKSTVVPVQLRPEYLPAVYAKLCFVRDKRLVSGSAMLNISREQKALRVAIVPDKPVYQPGEQATYRVTTTTPEGQPAPAEVSLGVVDKAIYAIESDHTADPLKFFYPKRDLDVETAFSFPDVYMSGDDKGAGAIPTRRFFADTAFWAPTVVTDAQGQATVSFPLPDNLTTWRTTCRAATLDTRVGQATAETLVQKPFLVRLEAPRFFTQGDEVEIGALVHNLTTGTLRATVGLQGDNLMTADARPATRRLRAGEIQHVSWRVSLPTVGPRRVRVWAQAGTYSDAMELTVPTLPRGRLHLDTRAGSAPGPANLRFAARQDLIPGSQRLTVRLSPSLMGAMLGALDYLAQYPYGCVEQTMSSFLPDVVLSQMLKTNHLDNPALSKKLPPMVTAGLLKLYGFQHADGGWGWWEYDKSDPWMTEYVLFGLVQAKQAGFPVTKQVLQDGFQALAQMDKQHLLDGEAQAFAAYVLALAGKADEANRLVQRFAPGAPPPAMRPGAPLPPRPMSPVPLGLAPRPMVRSGALSPSGRAFLSLALGRLGRAPEGKALAEASLAAYTGGGATALRSSDPGVLENAALALLAGSTLTPQDPRLASMVRGLLEAREGNHWISTRDTAFLLYALSAYLTAAHELQPDLEVRVTVNGQAALRRRFTAADVFQPEVELAIPPEQVAAGAAVVIETTGTGRLYYTATWAQAVAADLTTPVRSGSGLKVEREYRLVRPTPGKPGQSRLAPGSPQTRFRPGDLIEVSLTVRSARRLEHVLIEDPLPAGCEPQDQGHVDFYDWHNWWAQQITRDQQVAFAADRLEPGVNRLKYYLRAQTPGRYTALPPQAYDMYDPRNTGEGAAQEVRVE
ncbi:MAG TPA: alpha-2-macroglobulin family protein [Armatimonadota bacterium]|jgi:hypothetical protein